MKIIDTSNVPSRVIPEPYQRTLQLVLDKRDEDDVGDFSFILSTLYPFGGKTSSHSHQVDELMYITSGCGYCVTNRQKIPLRPGFTVYAKANENHQIVNESNETMRIACFFKPALPEQDVKEFEGYREKNARH